MEAEFETGRIAQEYATRFIRRGDMFDFSHIYFMCRSGHVQLAAFCVDIEAPRSVIGERQLKHILKKTQNHAIPRMMSNNYFKFGDVPVRSLGMVELHLKTPAPRRPIPVLMDIVPVDVPALLSLDVLDAECLYADNITNRIVHRIVISNPGDPLRCHDL